MTPCNQQFISLCNTQSSREGAVIAHVLSVILLAVLCGLTSCSGSFEIFMGVAYMPRLKPQGVPGLFNTSIVTLVQTGESTQ